MNRIMSPIISGLVYVIMFINVFFGGRILFYDSEDILKLLIIIIINIIDIMILIVTRVIFDVDNKKIISIPKVILNIFMILTTIVWWGEVKYDHLSRTASLCYFFIILWIILRIILAIIEVIMLVPEKTNKNYSNEKNRNSIIKPVIQLIGYIILVIAIFTGSVLAIFMPIIMFIIDSIMLATNKKDINLIKFMVSLIMMFTIMGIIILATDLLNFIILESIVQIILNIIEITTILPILKRNITKILIISISIVIICIIAVKINVVNLKYDIYQQPARIYGLPEQEPIIITSSTDFENFMENQLKTKENWIYETYGYERYGTKIPSPVIMEIEKYKEELSRDKQKIILNLGINEEFFDKYNIICGTYHKGSNASFPYSVRNIKYNRIKDKIYIEIEEPAGIGTTDSAYYEYFIKIDKKYIAPVECKSVSGIF